MNQGLITEKEFMELSRVHDLRCTSIFIPTERAGQEVDRGQGQIRLKNCLKEVRQKLEAEGWNSARVRKYLEPAGELLEENNFWRNQSDGLAVFLREEEIRFYTLPVHFDTKIYMADHFYLLPLIPYFNDNGRFYLLALSQQQVRLFEGSRHSISEVITGEDVPRRLEDVVGYDFRDSSLQFRTHQGGEAGTMFHGQGAGKDDSGPEVEKYFRAVDAGVKELIGDDRVPLVLACVDENFPLYRELTFHQQVAGYIPGHPDEADPLLLHEKAWDIVKDHFLQDRQKRTGQIQDLSASGRTSTDVGEIVPSAVEGRVDSLFIRKGEDLLGIYDMTGRRVQVDGERPNSVSLFNMAAVHTLENGGRVFTSMPGEATKINALMRY
jgi:hypothetical protein